MKKLKEFIRKPDCHASLAMTLGRKARGIAFTMAEILLSLTIIGIVAAITLPSLTANFQDKAFNAKRQALHARLAQAVRTLDYSDYLPMNIEDHSYKNGHFSQNGDRFIDDLGKALSIKNMTNSVGAEDGNFNFFEYISEEFRSNISYIQDMKGYTSPENMYHLQTVNGEDIVIFLMNPKYSDKNHVIQSLCFMLAYDLNGKKGPNKWGKDWGIMGAFYYDNMELYAPMFGGITDNIINEDYDPSDPNSQKYKQPNYRPASIEELVVFIPFSGLIPSIYDMDYTGVEDFWGMYSDDHKLNIIDRLVLCAIDGYNYNVGTLYTLDENSDTKQAREDNSHCFYLMVSNDGNSSKNDAQLIMR